MTRRENRIGSSSGAPRSAGSRLPFKWVRPARGTLRCTILPRTLEIEGASVWIALHDPGYSELASRIGTPRIAAPYAAGFALRFCDLAGFDVTSKRIWKDVSAIFTQVRDPGLSDWYRSVLARTR